MMSNANKQHSGGAAYAPNATKPSFGSTHGGSVFSGHQSSGYLTDALARPRDGKNIFNVVTRDETRSQLGAGEFKTPPGHSVAEGAVRGGTIVAVLGGAVGAITSVMTQLNASVAIPGLDLFFGGPGTSALLGAGLGCLAGGLLGALIGWSSRKNA